MDNDTTSFWIDIKKYEDILAKDPGSYCFAPLAELYRKLGLLDDAIAIAERGHNLHPEFVSGCMALGRVCLDKGLKERGQTLLEKVVRNTPENLLAQKLLSQLYIESGEIQAAEHALNVILALNPDDLESRVLMQSLSRSRQEEEESMRRASRFSQVAATAQQPEPVIDDSDLVIEDAELLEEISDEDFLVEDAASSGDFDWAAGEEEPPTPSHGKDPLTTGTLAELYASQGFVDKAVDIYKELLENDPGNEEVRQRLRQLAASASVDAAASFEMDVPSAPDTLATTKTGSSPPRTGADVVAILEGWLANIRRRG